MIAADGCRPFDKALQGVKSVKAVLDQFAAQGNSNRSVVRTAFGLDTIVSETSLFTHQNDIGPYTECELPSYMDPSGHMRASAKAKFFCHTTDNVVQYTETDSACNWTYVIIMTNLARTVSLTVLSVEGNFLKEEYAAQCGIFRHGQLVKLTITIRSVQRPAASKGMMFRNLHIGVKRLTLVGRNAEMVRGESHRSIPLNT